MAAGKVRTGRLENDVKRETPNLLASADDVVAGLSEDAFKVERYFPTLVFTLQVPDSEPLNDHLIEAIYAERERDRTGVRRSNYTELGGWHSQIRLHKEATFAGLVRYVDAIAEEMSRELGYHRSYRLRIGTMWSIINPPGGLNRAHIHPNCIWSGVYFVQAPKDSGRIEFIDPRTQNLMSRPKYIPDAKRPRISWRKVQYKPVAGKMLVFPSWLYHSVLPNRSKAKGKAADRVVVSFNLSQVRR